MKFIKSELKNSWQIVKPVAATNYVLNPSAETTGNYVAIGSVTITRSITYAKYGLYSYHLQTFATNTGISLTTGTLTNSDHWMTVRIRGRLPKELRFSIGPDSKKAIFLERIDDYWSLYGAMFGASESNGRTAVSINQFSTGSGDFYIDGIQVEPLGDWTTYVDGTQQGCEWNGVEHGSTSSRSGEYIGGGTPLDLYQEYKFFVTKIVGAGASTPTLSIDSYALLPGGELNSIKTESRQFTLIGKFITDTEMELHDARQDLIKTLKLATPGQPLKLRFSGGRVQKEIGIYYQGGLEGDLAEFYEGLEPLEDNQWAEISQYIEKASIQFGAPDPYWYEVGESATSLNNASDVGLYSEQDVTESATFRNVAARLRSTGQWSNLGPPSAVGGGQQVYAMAEDDTYLYIGGLFENFDGIAAADGIVRYNKQTGIYSAMGTGTPAGEQVNAIVVMSNGDVIAGGDFSAMGGVANTSGIAAWNGTAWRSIGGGGIVYSLVVGLDGKLYATGDFTVLGGVAVTRVGNWNGTIWTAMGSGLDQTGFSITVSPIDGTIYVGGVFSLAGGVANTAGVAAWNGSVWSPLSTGITGSSSFTYGAVYALAVNPTTGVLVAGGEFTTAGGNTIDSLAAWNGVYWTNLGGGVSHPVPDEVLVNELAFGADNMLYVTGFFTAAGDITPADRAARWNGYSWSHLDIDLPGLANVQGLLVSKHSDPVIKQKYNVYLGFNKQGTGSYAGKTVVSNEGNVPAFPQIVYYRSGGASALIETLRNERTGKELLYNYSLLNGESLITDLTPTKKSVISSFFGSRLDAVLPNSDFGAWSLLPGNNDVTTFVPVSGGPVLTAYLLWRDVYDSWD